MSRHPLRYALAALLALPALASAAALDLQLYNLRPDGAVRVEVYDNAERWQRAREPLLTRHFQARGVTQDLRIEGLAPGRYAVRLWQASGSGGLGRWPRQVVLARHGYSRRPLGGRRPPSFEAAAETLSGAALRLRVRANTVPD